MLWANLADEQYGSYSGKDSWWMFPTCRDGGSQLDGREFELDLFRDSTSCFRDGRPGVPIFAVGTSGEEGMLAELVPETADELTNVGFRLLAKQTLINNRWDRIWRRGYPDELLAGATLGEQAESLARWVVDTFETLHTVLHVQLKR